VRYPSVKIAMSEGGIGWVAMLLDRLDNIVDRSGYGDMFGGGAIRPADVLKRNFWFCTIDDPSTLGARERIGVDHIMVETDYPHADSSWPDTQELLEQRFAGLPRHHIDKMTHENAARLFRHPLPADGWTTAAPTNGTE
jgi:predicted TIM-barrel fold metal-dependent hydrolase